MNAVDVPVKTTGKAKQLAEHGIQYLGFYGRSDRTDHAMLHELHQAGIKLWTIQEKGLATHVGFFNATQGEYDGKMAVQFAMTMGMPKGKPVAPCVDYDASEEDIKGPVGAYLRAFHGICDQYGYLSMPYGNSSVLKWALANGVAHYGWLSQSTGFLPYDDNPDNYRCEGKPALAIIQKLGTDPCGCGGDPDVVLLPEVCW